MSMQLGRTIGLRRRRNLSGESIANRRSSSVEEQQQVVEEIRLAAEELAQAAEQMRHLSEQMRIDVKVVRQTHEEAPPASPRQTATPRDTSGRLPNRLGSSRRDCAINTIRPGKPMPSSVRSWMRRGRHHARSSG